MSNERQPHQAPVPKPWEERAPTAVLPSSGAVQLPNSISRIVVLLGVLINVLVVILR